MVLIRFMATTKINIASRALVFREVIVDGIERWIDYEEWSSDQRTHTSSS